MKYSDSLLDEIRARLPVSTVVGRRVKLRKQGREWRGLSPFQAEKTPSFFVNDQKQFYHCFSSGKHGDIFRFLTETEGLSFPEAVEKLAAEAGVPLPVATRDDVRREKARATLHEVMEHAAAFFEARLQAREGAAARGYLADRHLTPTIQSQFRLGFAPEDRFGLRDHLASMGVDRDAMIAAGLLIHGGDVTVPYDRFRDRIMFPIQDGRGRIIAFGGRAMAKDPQAKYLNSPETELFHKGWCLYNHHRARAEAHRSGRLIAVEGYVDAIMMSTAGFGATVAPLGTALTEEQLKLMWQMCPEPILCFDGDKAGRKAAWRAIDVALPHIGPDKSLRFALLPDGQDPDDLVRKSGRAAVEEVVASAQPLADILWAREAENGDFSTPERRAAVEKRLGEAVAAIRDEAVRKYYRAEMDTRLRSLLAPRRSVSGALAGNEGRNSWPRRGGRQAEPSSLGPMVSPAIREGSIMRGNRSAIPAREALMLAAVIGHPGLLDRFCEDIAAIEIENPEAERLRRSLIDCAMLGPATSEDVFAALTNQDGDNLARRLYAGAIQLHWWVRSETAWPDVEQAFVHVLTLHRKMRTLNRELRMAATALEMEFTDENFAHLTDIKNQIATIEGQEAAIEGFGASSGRLAE